MVKWCVLLLFILANVSFSAPQTVHNDLTVTGSLAAVTVNTGQGANELYDMNQNVLTTNRPYWAGVGVGDTSVDWDFYCYNSADMSSKLGLAYIWQDYADTESKPALAIRQDGNGDILQCFSGTAKNFYVDSGGTVNAAKGVSGTTATLTGAITGLTLGTRSALGYGHDFTRDGTTGALRIQGNQAGYTDIVLCPTSGNVEIGADTGGVRSIKLHSDTTGRTATIQTLAGGALKLSNTYGAIQIVPNSYLWVTAPTDALFDIGGNFKVRDNDSSDTDRFSIDSSTGYVTLGTDAVGAQQITMHSGASSKSSTIATGATGSLTITSPHYYVMKAITQSFEMWCLNAFGWYDASGNAKMTLAAATGNLVLYGSLSTGGASPVERISSTGVSAFASGSYTTKVTADSAALKPGVTIIVAASNSRGNDAADYICDGTADDVQIQAAIDAVSALGGGLVRLLDGDYVIATAVTMKSNVDICGLGDATQLTAATETNIFKFIGVAVSNVVISDLYLQTSSAGMTVIWAGDDDNLENIAIRNCTINAIGADYSAAISFGDSAAETVTTLRIEKCKITSSATYGYGIIITKPVTGLWIQDCLISQTNASGYNAVAVYGNSTNFHVNRNNVVGTGHAAIAMSPASMGEVTGNIVDAPATADEGGIEVEWKGSHGGTETSHHVTVSDNIVYSGNLGIYTHKRDTGTGSGDPYKINIHGNTLRDMTIGVKLYYGADITVYGNIYDNCSTDYSAEAGVTLTAFESRS